MPDISMCAREDCPLKKDCYRNAASGTVPNEHWQAWTTFGGDDPAGCEDYWPVRKGG